MGKKVSYNHENRLRRKAIKTAYKDGRDRWYPELFVSESRRFAIPTWVKRVI